MTVARVASAESIRTDTSNPYAFNYTGGTPEGIAIAVMHDDATQLVTALTHGGVAMTLAVTATVLVSAIEGGRVDIWFLGSGVLTGLQSISATIPSASALDIHFVLWELSGLANLEVIDFDSLSQRPGTNPVLTMQAGGRTKISLAALKGSEAAPTGTIQTGNTLDHTHDFGNHMSQTSFEAAVDSSDQIVGWSTLASGNHALAAIAVSEVPAAGSVIRPTLRQIQAVNRAANF